MHMQSQPNPSLR